MHNDNNNDNNLLITMEEERIREIAREEIANAIPAKEKGKRKPNKWQLFLKECTPKHSDVPIGERVKACSAEYREIKKTNSQLLDELVDKHNQTLQNNK